MQNAPRLSGVRADVERLERQLRGETAKWVLLSVSNNCLYDHGVCKLVEVLQKTTAPLETLDLSKTGMTSSGAKLVAELLAATEGTNLLPLKKLVLHGNAIGADGYAAIGAAIRHPRCALVEFVVSTQMREKKTSPHTNEEMGSKLIPALQVKNMIDRMVRTGAWTGERARRSPYRKEWLSKSWV